MTACFVIAMMSCMMTTVYAGSSVSPEFVNVLSLYEGAMPVVIPETYGSWYAEGLLDQSPSTGWACESGSIHGNTFVFELAGESVIETFEFDTAAIDADGAGARDIFVEVSTESKDSGFIVVLEATLESAEDGQTFQVSRKVPARWVRLTIRNNYGNTEWTELFSFRGYGEKPAPELIEDISGTYESDYSEFHVRQQGTALIGCYEYDEGLLEGTIEGRVMKITWMEAGGPDDSGPAVMVFARDGKSFKGNWWYKGNESGRPDGTWDGKKNSDVVGGCPHWSGSIEGELKRKMETDGRARLYGILFDLDSAVIRPESEEVLSQVTMLLDGEPGWIITVEGHTDGTGSEEHNQSLSERRAVSVREYLVKHGIHGDRIKTVGFGESRPVADNATEVGRAQNRRVELVRE